MKNYEKIEKFFLSRNVEILDNLENLVEEKDFDEKSIKEVLFKIDEMKKYNIEIKFLDSFFYKIILDLKLNDLIISKFKKINLEDFYEFSKKRKETIRHNKIHYNFIKFLRIELLIDDLEKHEVDKSLIDNLNKKIKKNDFGDEKINSEIFIKKKNFDTNLDSIEKAEKRNVKIDFDYVSKPEKISVNNFILYFNKRYEYYLDILKKKIDEENYLTIKNLAEINNTNSSVSVIGLVLNIEETKNGHKIIELEDKSGIIKCFVNKDKTNLLRICENICLDEGIAINGKIGDKIVWIDEIILSTNFENKDYKKIDIDEYIGFISDTHFGAKVFVDSAMSKLIDFLNGETQNEKLNKISKKLKYIFYCGDVIEGCGVYPNQGKDARLLSTEMQYCEAARWLDKIPKDKTIIIIPGNHDTERLSEPQPKLPYDKAYAIYNLENVIVLSNPSTVTIYEDQNINEKGFKVMQYHGGSIFYYADVIKNLREKGGAKVPEEVIKYLIEKRHLAPTHGATLYIPDTKFDPLTIKNIPDFFVVGHTHKHSIKNFKGCTIVSCGCWVEMSDYQEKMGMYPDIGKFTLVNTKTRKPLVLNLYEENYRKEKNKKEDV